MKNSVVIITAIMAGVLAGCGTPNLPAATGQELSQSNALATPAGSLKDQVTAMYASKFKAMNISHDGKLTLHQYAMWLSSQMGTPVSDAQAEQYFDQLDVNHVGYVTQDQWLAASGVDSTVDQIQTDANYFVRTYGSAGTLTYQQYMADQEFSISGPPGSDGKPQDMRMQLFQQVAGTNSNATLTVDTLETLIVTAMSDNYGWGIVTH